MADRGDAFNAQNGQEKKKAEDPAFRAAGNRAGLQIWRVENFNLKPYPEKEYGKFFEGDSYVILKSDGINDKNLNYHIHFWLGKKTSKDEAGTAAMKAVELDDYLGGAPVQYREIQQHESRQFVSYFKKGIRYAEGGVQSGFRTVEKVHEKRLFHIKGKKRTRMSQVPMSAESLNHGDVFILEDGPKLYVWCGSDSNKRERIKGMENAKEIRDSERAGRGHVIVVEDDPNYKPHLAKDGALKEFYTGLGGFGAIKSAADAGNDLASDRSMLQGVTLYRVSDASGTTRMEEVAQGKLSYNMLDNKDAFILDLNGTEIFTWIGRHATKNEKLETMKRAVVSVIAKNTKDFIPLLAFQNQGGKIKAYYNFLRTKKYPDYTQVCKVRENSEPISFKQWFSDWPGATGLVNPNGPPSGRIAHVQQQKFDATTLHHMKKVREEREFDDGSGNVNIWRVENMELVQQSPELSGTLFGGDCYVMLYTYQVRGREHYIIYYWLGGNSSQDERGAAALLVVDMDDKMSGAALQIRIVQGKETEHFMRMFKGKLTIYKGGKASGFRGHREELQKTGQARMFQVRGTSATSNKAVEVEPAAFSLNSNDVFVVCTPKSTFLWYGKGCTGDEREMAKEVAKNVVKQVRDEFDIIMEGKETDKFWNAIGGKGPYASGKHFAMEVNPNPPRLFHCSNETGRFLVTELCEFSQEDLEEDDVMILDIHEAVFVWIGKDANAIEKKEAMQTAMEYVKTDPSPRSPDDVQIIRVNQGHEPLLFTGNFQGWVPGGKKPPISYEEMKNQLHNENSAISIVEEELKKFEISAKYTYQELTSTELPEGIDTSKKEYYLKPDEFHKLFGMPVADYEKIPEWKRNTMKKQAGLF